MAYQCEKCNCIEFETGEFGTSSTGAAIFFDIQTQKFITVSCKKCGYTEIYKKTVSTGENVLNFLVGG